MHFTGIFRERAENTGSHRHHLGDILIRTAIFLVTVLIFLPGYKAPGAVLFSEAVKINKKQTGISTYFFRQF
jgi:hypothetical protein